MEPTYLFTVSRRLQHFDGLKSAVVFCCYNRIEKLIISYFFLNKRQLSLSHHGPNNWGHPVDTIYQWPTIKPILCTNDLQLSQHYVPMINHQTNTLCQWSAFEPTPIKTHFYDLNCCKIGEWMVNNIQTSPVKQLKSIILLHCLLKLLRAGSW